MNLTAIVFYSFEFLAALAAIGILFSRNVFYAALLLIICLLALAGIYVLAFAEFIAVTQILVYAAGILVLVLFGIMLTSKINGKVLFVENNYWFSGGLVGLGTLVMLCILYSRQSYVSDSAVIIDHKNHINTIGILFMSEYALPFEVVGILLLITLVGAAVVASSFQSFKKQ